MPCRIRSYVLQGIDALYCEVELDFDDRVEADQCRTIIVGLPDAAVKNLQIRMAARADC
jgi:hypothetical protein